MQASISIRVVGSEELDAFGTLLGAIEGEGVQDPQGPARAEEGLRQALARYDFTRSDSFWILLARLGGHPAGYAAVCRIPKADARAGFLFVDELHVSRAFRRQGVATALLERVGQMARDLGLAGVRLLVRPENEAARRLYRSADFVESESLFCEKLLENRDVLKDRIQGR